jgi:zinc transporter ZupT
MWENSDVRSIVAMAAGVMTAASLLAAAPPAAADECNYPDCTPGIQPNVVLGSYCDNFTYYAFGVTSWGRLVFCGSPRRYDARWFRSPEMHGIKNENDFCNAQDGDVAQAPDGLFLTCVAKEGATRWIRGDL